MAPYSNDPHASPYAQIPNPIPNIDFPLPYWINKLRAMAFLGCLNPDLAYVDLAAAALGKMAWSIITPSTKQLIEGGTGRSWLCGSKQILGSVETGEQIASSGAGRFIYGMLAGFDIAAYHAFFLSTGAVGVIDFASYAKKFQRICTSDQSPYRGIDPVGGWPTSGGGYGAGPSYLTTAGNTIGSTLRVPKGYFGIYVAWTSYSLLDVTGGVSGNQILIDADTGEIYDTCAFNNIADPNQHAINFWHTNEGVATREYNIDLRVGFTAALGPRAVTNTGGCYVRAAKFNDPSFPPFWSMRMNAGTHGN